jgi:glycosyltransferase involved in cell wall biosynthesis
VTDPRVALGLFVYNGERHIAAALDSLLDQTMGDFVLDISDNASTDGTEEICRSYAAEDGRIRYVRQPRNQGAAWNCNFVAQASPRSPYFKWCAHDDIHDPTYLEQCVDMLDDNPTLVCCQPRTRYINDNGDELLRSFRRQQFDDPRPWVRFNQVLRRHHDFTYAFALTRRSALDQMRPFQPVFLGDGIMLSELAFQGRFGEVADHLFGNRMHSTRSSVVTTSGRGQNAWVEWWGSSQAYPMWRTLSELDKSIARSPMGSGDKLRCYKVLEQWVQDRWRGFSWELVTQLPRSAGRLVSSPPTPN